MILRGGFNVYPREIEELMMTHPAVALVAVIGVPDERLGEEVKALVVRRPGDRDQRAVSSSTGAGTSAQPTSTPRSVEFREALPVGATGKIIKRELRSSA